MLARRRPSLLGLAFWIGVSYAAALPGMLFMPDGWYRRLEKPWWTPPDAVFGPVWTVLFTLMGVAMYMVSRRDQHPYAPRAYALFFVQLTLNMAWSPLFFGLRRPDLALVDIALLWLTLVAMIRTFHGIRPAAGLSQIPYLLWISFAAALNAAIWWLNR